MKCTHTHKPKTRFRDKILTGFASRQSRLVIQPAGRSEKTVWAVPAVTVIATIEIQCMASWPGGWMPGYCKTFSQLESWESLVYVA